MNNVIQRSESFAKQTRDYVIFAKDAEECAIIELHGRERTGLPGGPSMHRMPSAIQNAAQYQYEAKFYWIQALTSLLRACP